MDQLHELLDLSIMLTPPPDNVSPEVLATIALRCEPLGTADVVGVLTDPLTNEERKSLLWYLEEYWEWPYEGFAARGRYVEMLLIDIGKRLYQAVFGSVEAQDIVQQWERQPAIQYQISVVSDIPNILSLPWELLYDAHSFLVLRHRTPISLVRRLPQHEEMELSATFPPPLRILFITARPEGAGFIDPRNIARELLDEVQDQVEDGAIEIEFLRPPTLSALCTRLEHVSERPIHLLHFDGHGVFDEEKNKQGVLLFETEAGRPHRVKARKLAEVLQASGIHLVILTACQSAMSATDNAFSSVAAQLIQSGIDAVVAMSASVLVASATSYAKAFYHELAKGTTLLLAHERARQALHDDPRRHPHRRYRNEEGQRVELSDWWLPHFYQRHSVILHPMKAEHLSIKLPQSSPSRRLSEQIPGMPYYGFSGRARELLQIERHLLWGRPVIVHGFGGIGKTTLMREAADWLTRTKMYDGFCYVSFEDGGDATMLLSVLGRYLDAYDGRYNPNEPSSALARLVPILKKKRTLVIGDDLESILPHGKAPLSAVVRTKLWDVLLELMQMGTGILLASRNNTFGDKRLAHGSYAAYLQLSGLDPEDAYAVASHILDELEIDRKCVPYAELHDLLAQLDHHPLAIQLVLPALRRLPLTRIRDDFSALLPQFVDDTTTGRNRSLSASLEYSLQWLSGSQQALLPLLAVFEGGVMENNLLAITQIPVTEWIKLRTALVQTALVTTEQVHEAGALLFLRFHPLLTPFLRNLASAKIAELRERYMHYYYRLAEELYFKDPQNPQLMRTLAQRELPNLRRALGLLLEEGNVEAASHMADHMVLFLNFFGLGRERDELRQRIGKATATESIQKDGMLTHAEWLRELGLGEDEFGKGHLGSASTRFTTLLARIEAIPEGMQLGRGSFAHSVTLSWLARCLIWSGQLADGEKRLHEAIAVVDTLMMQDPTNQDLNRERGGLMCELGDLLTTQGQYQQAQGAYQEALKIAQQQGNPTYQATVHAQLGRLALERNDYTEARLNFEKNDYTEARLNFEKAANLIQDLGEPESEARVLHNLGLVAQLQEEWTKAEQYYRESLAIKESLGNEAGINGAAMTCSAIARIGVKTGRLDEAEGWFKRAVELEGRANPSSSVHALYLTNLATILLDQMQAGHTSVARLNEAQSYAEQALIIRETLDDSSEIWKTLGILGAIADLEAQTELARYYQRRMRETFATFPGHRFYINSTFGWLIAAIAASARGDIQYQAAIEERLSELEAQGWNISTAVQYLWEGERDWSLLVEDMSAQEALLVLRVLELLTQPNEAENRILEQAFRSLPTAIRTVVIRTNDESALKREMKTLSLEERMTVEEVLRLINST